MNVPKSFWSDEVLTTYLINRMPSKTLGGNSPIEILCPNTPLFQVSPKIYGCMCFVHIPKHQHDKLDPKVSSVIFKDILALRKPISVILLGRMIVVCTKQSRNKLLICTQLKLASAQDHYVV